MAKVEKWIPVNRKTDFQYPAVDAAEKAKLQADPFSKKRYRFIKIEVEETEPVKPTGVKPADAILTKAIPEADKETPK